MLWYVAYRVLVFPEAGKDMAKGMGTNMVLTRMETDIGPPTYLT